MSSQVNTLSNLVIAKFNRPCCSVSKYRLHYTTRYLIYKSTCLQKAMIKHINGSTTKSPLRASRWIIKKSGAEVCTSEREILSITEDRTVRLSNLSGYI
ncbi:hypothetical protein D915_000155 [Fasciola hepatica]|uniref:Uncharacterized protein n=1 Tax=Fasciola hepatica TaxID=6192 RepID=A0A4E0RPK5_FASHE|nr:hypothetical protein D915_000155 [Fasciola hepatica]